MGRVGEAIRAAKDQDIRREISEELTAKFDGLTSNTDLVERLGVLLDRGLYPDRAAWYEELPTVSQLEGMLIVSVLKDLVEQEVVAAPDAAYCTGLLGIADFAQA